ncbi:MAG TPA: hypothetical protein VMD59_01070 [Acidimicrobiales bacterium]|nr:hypothetical protein [Acidimicrobiales bacterium]
MTRQAAKVSKPRKSAGKQKSFDAGTGIASAGDRDRKGRKDLRTLAAVAQDEHWKEEPDDRDYPAALDYLSLLLADAGAEHAVEVLKKAPLVRRKAKDLLRASGLALLSAGDPAVARDLAKVNAGEKLSPVLLLRGRIGTDVPLTIADGYHRVCASYHLDEDALIPCRLGDIARR